MLKSICIFLSIFFFIIASFGCGEESISIPEQRQPAYDGTIVAIGDSLTEGLGVEEEFTYPALLQSKLMQDGYRYKVINAGVSGETSSGALSRINWALTLNPDIVILVTGANDGLRGVDPNLLRNNLDQIVSIIKENNIGIILAGMKMFPNLGPEYTPAFSKVYPDIAQKHEIPLIPFFLEGVAGQTQFNQKDRIHPNPEGTRRIVDNIYPFVLESVRKHLKR